MSNVKVRTVSRSDVNEENLLIFIRDEWLPIPKSIIPPERKNFLWNTLELQPYDSSGDYRGKPLDNLRFAIHRTIRNGALSTALTGWVCGFQAVLTATRYFV